MDEQWVVMVYRQIYVDAQLNRIIKACGRICGMKQNAQETEWRERQVSVESMGSWWVLDEQGAHYREQWLEIEKGGNNSFEDV